MLPGGESTAEMAAGMFLSPHTVRDSLTRNAICWQRTLTEAAIRSGRLDLARALRDERLSLRDTSVYGLLARSRVSALSGDDIGAAQTRERATANRNRFSAAAG